MPAHHYPVDLTAGKRNRAHRVVSWDGGLVAVAALLLTGFVIATVVVMPLTAFLGRFFGQKRVYLFSLALFVVGSALCGLARSLPMMVFCRALQGLVHEVFPEFPPHVPRLELALNRVILRPAIARAVQPVQFEVISNP